RDGDQSDERFAADVRRARILTRFPDGAHGARCAHVYHRRRHSAGVAELCCQPGAGLEATADAERVCGAGLTAPTTVAHATDAGSSTARVSLREALRKTGEATMDVADWLRT